MGARGTPRKLCRDPARVLGSTGTPVACRLGQHCRERGKTPLPCRLRWNMSPGGGMKYQQVHNLRIGSTVMGPRAVTNAPIHDTCNGQARCHQKGDRPALRQSPGAGTSPPKGGGRCSDTLHSYSTRAYAPGLYSSLLRITRLQPRSGATPLDPSTLGVLRSVTTDMPTTSPLH